MNKILLYALLSSIFLISLSGDDIYEPNNSFQNAQTINSGAYSLSALDTDWFKMELTTGSLQLVMNPSDSTDINMILYNENEEVVSANFTSSTETINYEILLSGTYYIKIETPNPNSNANYTLHIAYSSTSDDVYEPNNTLQDAKTITIGTHSLNALNEDWFKVDIKTGSLELSMTPSSGVDVNMALYNANGTVVAANWVAGTETIVYDVILSGIYYIKVAPSVPNIYTNYTLSVNYTTLIVWEKELEFGPIRDVSVALFDIDKDGKDEIFVGTSKALDSNLNEIRPAGLICLEDDGTVKWTRTFPAMDTPDSQTGKMYNTTSVSSAPYFSDIDGDEEIDIIVGVGADTFGEAGPDVVGQPGDKGGVYALDKNGNIKWFHQSLDTIGGTENIGDSRPDGVYGTPIVYDIDRDGVKDVIYNGWDQYMWILNAKDGTEKIKVHLLDTIWSTPAIADINQDGTFEILVTADITENSDAGTTTGGIFHVLSSNGTQNIAGFNDFIGNSGYTTLKGKAEEQALWSSPVVADIDGDGKLEIAYGTGNYFHDERGTYIKVWNYDGTLRFKLDTVGRTFSTPLLADINGNGNLEILATTLEGYLYCWDNAGTLLFATQTTPYKATSNEPIFSSPVAVDTNGNGKLEIIYAQGAQVIMVNSLGEQISDNNKREMIFEQFKGSLAAKDIDNDGIVDLISGGTNTDKDKAVIYRWKINDYIHTSQNNSTTRYQLVQSNDNIKNFVKRFYNKVLDRDADTWGLTYWTDELATAVRAGSDVARGFIFSQEFMNKNVNNNQFLTILYGAFFNRSPDTDGFNQWKAQLENNVSRSDILNGFLYSPEFGILSKTYNILPVGIGG